MRSRMSRPPGAEERRFGRGHKKIRAWDVPTYAAGDDPVFALVHGLGVSSGYFAAVTERLRETGRVVVFDLPGFGGVPHPRDPLSIEEFARGVELGLDELGIEDAVLVGHSMGAQVVIEVARSASPRGRRLVLIGPVVRDDQRSLRRVVPAFARSAVHERFGAAMASVRGYLRAGVRWSVEVMPAMVSYPIEERIAGLGGRIAIVHGAQDRLCHGDWPDRLLEASGAEGRVILVPDAAHQVVVDNADEVVEAARWVAAADAV